jgi:hypothetical protein
MCRVRHQKTLPHAPQTSIRAVRTYQSVTRRVRSILISTKLPKILWAEVALGVIFVENQIPKKSTNNILLIE